uniref:MSP domain-containing protein n=1 Tax=Ascaris lumbricoides TaxID=6252 RepID=A0A0M3I6Q8_ASCLU
MSAFIGDAISVPSSLSSVLRTRSDSSTHSCKFLSATDDEGSQLETALSSSVSTIYSSSETYSSESSVTTAFGETSSGKQETNTRNSIVTAVKEISTGKEDVDVTLPKPIFSKNSTKPLGTAVVFPNENCEVPRDTSLLYNITPRFVDSLELIGKVPCDPVPFDELPREWQLIQNSSEESKESSIDGARISDCTTARSILTSHTAPHSEYYSHPPNSEYFVDKDLIEKKKGFGSTFYPSEYVMEELNANAMEFTTVSHKKEKTDESAEQKLIAVEPTCAVFAQRILNDNQVKQTASVVFTNKTNRKLIFIIRQRLHLAVSSSNCLTEFVSKKSARERCKSNSFPAVSFGGCSIFYFITSNQRRITRSSLHNFRTAVAIGSAVYRLRPSKNSVRFLLLQNKLVSKIHVLSQKITAKCVS